MLNKFFKRFFSIYSLRYPRSIVYMLQASEYKISAYLDWHKRVQDLRYVEVRKHFVRTAKSVLLLAVTWLTLLCIYALAFFVVFSKSTSIKYFLFLIIIILAPHVLAYFIIIPLFLVKILIQNPIQYFIIKEAKEKLKKHKALKIGIAGSFGKTTMREILKTVLSEGKRVASPEKNYNTLIGISNFTKSLKGNEEVLIFELGEYYKGDIKEMCELVRPDIGMITGVNEAHLEKFKSLDTTAGTIFELADWLESHTGLPCVNPTQGSPVCYVNGENEIAKKYASKLKSDTNSAIAESVSSSFVFYERKGINGIKVSNSKTGLSGTSFVVGYKDKTFEFKSKLLGLHHLGPLAAAIDMALRFGMKIEDIQKGIANTKPFEHRIEVKPLSGGVTMLDDSYNGNPDGVKAVIEFLASLEGYRRFYITPGLVEMGEKTEVVHKEIGKNLAQAGIEKVILIKNSVTSYIEKGLKETNYKGEVIWFDDSLKALAALPHLTVSGDVVLLQNDWGDQYY